MKSGKNVKFRQSLFWDVDPRTTDPKKHAQYIIERILDLGDEKEVRWMSHFYPHSLIRRVLRESRVVHDKSKGLWARVF